MFCRFSYFEAVMVEDHKKGCIHRLELMSDRLRVDE